MIRFRLATIQSTTIRNRKGRVHEPVKLAWADYPGFESNRGCTLLPISRYQIALQDVHPERVEPPKANSGHCAWGRGLGDCTEGLSTELYMALTGEERANQAAQLLAWAENSGQLGRFAAGVLATTVVILYCRLPQDRLCD